MNQHCQLYNQLMAQADACMNDWRETERQIDNYYRKMIDDKDWYSLLSRAEEQMNEYARLRDEAILADRRHWQAEIDAQQRESNELHQMEQELRGA